MDDVAMQNKEPENQIDQKKPPHSVTKEQMANHHNGSDDPASDGNCDDQGNINSKMIDLNMQPVRTNGQGSNSQVCHMVPYIYSALLIGTCSFPTCNNCSSLQQIQTQGVELSVNNHDSPGAVPTTNYEADANK